MWTPHPASQCAPHILREAPLHQTWWIFGGVIRISKNYFCKFFLCWGYIWLWNFAIFFFFRKRGLGGIKGRLNLFKKVISFSGALAGLPLAGQWSRCPVKTPQCNKGQVSPQTQCLHPILPETAPNIHHDQQSKGFHRDQQVGFIGFWDRKKLMD